MSEYSRVVCVVDNDLEDVEQQLLVNTAASVCPVDVEVVPYAGDWLEVARQIVPTDLLVLCGKHVCSEALGRDIAIKSHAGAVETLNFGEQNEEGTDQDYTAICQLSPAFIVRESGRKGGSSEKHVRLWTDVWEQIVRMCEGHVEAEPMVVALEDESEVLALLSDLMDFEGAISYDYETWGDVDALRPELCRDFKIVSCGLGWVDDNGVHGVSFLFDRPRRASPALVRAWTALIGKANAVRVAHFCRYEHKCNIKRFGRTWLSRDTMLQTHALDELADGSLARVMVRCGLFWGGFKKRFEDIRRNPMESPVDKLLQYNGLDGFATACCHQTQEIELAEEGLTAIARQDEEFSMNLAYQEMHGIKVDSAQAVVQRERVRRDADKMLVELRRQPVIRKVEEWAWKNIKTYQRGKERPAFNPKSTPMMRRLVLEELKIKVAPKKKNGKETISLNSDTLDRYVDAHPLLRMLNDYRSRESLFIFLQKWDKFIGADQCVHSNYNQHIVVTGRLSSTEPPLQNIPKDDEIRRVFVSRFEGGWLVNADYAQQEPRLIAGWAQEKRLMEAILAGKNLHAYVGSVIFKQTYEQVISNKEGKEYDRGKKMNLGIAYGQTEYGLADKTGMSIDAARDLLRDYNAEFPGIETWRLGFHKDAMQYGYVEDLFGARRHLPAAMSSNKWERERALRQAGNFPVQGTAFRFTQIAATVLTGLLQEFCPGKAFVVGQVHDSIIVDADPSVLDLVLALTQEAMLVHNHMPYWKDKGMPMAVDLKIGRNLYDMTPIKVAA